MKASIAHSDVFLSSDGFDTEHNRNNKNKPSWTGTALGTVLSDMD